MVRVGVSPLSWVNEVLEDLGRGTSAETCLREAAEAGYQGVELSRIFPKKLGELAELLSRFGLQLISGWHSGFLADRSVAEELEAVEAHASLLRACGTDIMVYGECGSMVADALDVPMSRRLRMSPELVPGYGERLTRFAEALSDAYELRLAYHHHLMMVAERLDEVASVMDATGEAVGLLLDTGHAHAGGFSYHQLIERFPARINHIHLKDVRGPVMSEVRERDLTFNEGVRKGMFTVPGDGILDFGPLSQFVVGGTFKGWMVVEAEQDPVQAPPASAVKRARNFVRDHILASE
jgi:inosose dehydratase